MRVVAHFLRGGVSVCGRGHSGYADEAKFRAAAFSRCSNCIDKLYRESKKVAAPARDEHGNEEIPFDREAECGSPEDASCARSGICSHEATIWQMNDMHCNDARLCAECKDEHYANRAAEAAPVQPVGVVAAPKQLALF